MSSKNHEILITGGLGYIGKHLAVDLLKQNIKVVIVDDLSNSCIKTKNKIEELSLKNVTFYQADIADKQMMNQILSSHSIGMVVHLSASKYVMEAEENPEKYIENNVKATSNLLEVCHENNVKKIVFSSTSAVYSSKASLPYAEDSLTTQEESVYGKTKLLGEEMIRHYVDNHGFNAVILRLFNVFGCSHEFKNVCTKSMPFKNIYEILTEKIDSNSTLDVFVGHETIDGSSIRDYIAINDVVRAIDTSIRHCLYENFNLWNVGTGVGTSTLQLIVEIERKTGKIINLNLKNPKHRESPKSIANINQIQKNTLWKPSINYFDCFFNAQN